MLPVETVLAVFPATVAVGKITLRPLTVAHVMAMEMLGIEIDGAVNDSQVFIAAWLMSKPPDEVCGMMEGAGISTEEFGRWMAATAPEIKDAVTAVRRVIGQAYQPFVPGESKSQNVSKEPQGYGWPLEIAEAFVGEYGVTFEEAITTPLSRMFGMMACCRVRNGGKPGGPDYYERKFVEQMKGRKKVKHG